MDRRLAMDLDRWLTTPPEDSEYDAACDHTEGDAPSVKCVDCGLDAWVEDTITVDGNAYCVPCYDRTHPPSAIVADVDGDDPWSLTYEDDPADNSAVVANVAAFRAAVERGDVPEMRRLTPVVGFEVAARILREVEDRDGIRIIIFG